MNVEIARPLDSPVPIRRIAAHHAPEQLEVHIHIDRRDNWLSVMERLIMVTLEQQAIIPQAHAQISRAGVVLEPVIVSRFLLTDREA